MLLFNFEMAGAARRMKREVVVQFETKLLLGVIPERSRSSGVAKSLP
jgi:hypothetical protein